MSEPESIVQRLINKLQLNQTGGSPKILFAGSGPSGLGQKHPFIVNFFIKHDDPLKSVSTKWMKNLGEIRRKGSTEIYDRFNFLRARTRLAWKCKLKSNNIVEFVSRTTEMDFEIHVAIYSTDFPASFVIKLPDQTKLLLNELKKQKGAMKRLISKGTYAIRQDHQWIYGDWQRNLDTIFLPLQWQAISHHLSSLSMAPRQCIQNVCALVAKRLQEKPPVTFIWVVTSHAHRKCPSFSAADLIRSVIKELDRICAIMMKYPRPVVMIEFEGDSTSKKKSDRFENCINKLREIQKPLWVPPEAKKDKKKDGSDLVRPKLTDDVIIRPFYDWPGNSMDDFHDWEGLKRALNQEDGGGGDEEKSEELVNDSDEIDWGEYPNVSDLPQTFWRYAFGRPLDPPEFPAPEQSAVQEEVDVRGQGPPVHPSSSRPTRSRDSSAGKPSMFSGETPTTRESSESSPMSSQLFRHHNPVPYYREGAPARPRSNMPFHRRRR